MGSHSAPRHWHHQAGWQEDNMSSRTTSCNVSRAFCISRGTPAKENISLTLQQGHGVPLSPHTTPPARSPDSARFPGFSPPNCPCQLPGNRNPSPSQQHWIQHTHCKREARQQHKDIFGTVQASGSSRAALSCHARLTDSLCHPWEPRVRGCSCPLPTLGLF